MNSFQSLALSKKDNLRNSLLALLTVILLVVTPQSVRAAAATYTWNDGASDNTWATSNDWTLPGPPTSADTAVFDTLGNTSAIAIGSSDTANVIDFGASSSSSSTQAFTLGTAAHAGTITFASTVSGANGTSTTGSIVYQGTSTSTETINADVVFSVTGSGSLYLGNFTTGGTLTINGNIEHSGTQSTVGDIYVKGTGVVNLAGAVGGATDGGSTAFAHLNDYMMAGGTLVLSGSVATSGGGIVLGGATAGSETGGDLLIETSNLGSNSLTLATNNSTGTFQFSGGIDVSGNNIGINNLRTAGNAGGAASLENLSGDNSIGTVISNKTGGDYNIESDAGTLSVSGINDTATSGSPQTALLYGAGNGNVVAAITDTGSSKNSLAVVKDGAGAWTLSNGAGNTYTGGTTILQGTLQVANATGSATGTGNVTLGAATLTGTGAISGTVQASGAAGSSIITPATVNTIGNLALGGVTSTSGLTFNLAIDGPGAANSTLTLGSAGLTVTGGTLTFNLYDLGSNALVADTPYTIITGTGALSATSIVANLVGSSYVLDTSYGTDGILFSGDTATFEIEAVPEPGTCVLLFGGVVLLFLYEKRRRPVSWLSIW